MPGESIRASYRLEEAPEKIPVIKGIEVPQTPYIDHLRYSFNFGREGLYQVEMARRVAERASPAAGSFFANDLASEMVGHANRASTILRFNPIISSAIVGSPVQTTGEHAQTLKDWSMVGMEFLKPTAGSPSSTAIPSASNSASEDKSSIRRRDYSLKEPTFKAENNNEGIKSLFSRAYVNISPESLIFYVVSFFILFYETTIFPITSHPRFIYESENLLEIYRYIRVILFFKTLPHLQSKFISFFKAFQGLKNKFITFLNSYKNKL